MKHDYTDPVIRQKARAAAVFFGEPACAEFRSALDCIEALQARIDQLTHRPEGHVQFKNTGEFLLCGHHRSFLRKDGGIEFCTACPDEETDHG